ncbi:hypothetical protein BD410DRAFT_316580 [Rickenella mellea]|uniref:Mixed lineage kinase domain-containing protein n=1 Tax=Rickenella mellea TaxID=50990 RepID=A0A4Y7Q0G3_9AGAM|nr:hypothetical protein BD410DRAFT_316580 [Rickenella mellea]
MASTSKCPTLSSKSATATDLLDNSIAVLQAAGQLAPLIPVPFVASIFVSATVIVDAARNVQQNKLNCAKLAKRVADLTHDVHKEIHGREELVDDRLNAALQQLQDKLSEIQRFMQEQASKSTLRRIISRANISTQITELTVELDYVMRTFKTTALIRMELHMAEVNQKLAVIDQRANEERKWDGKHFGKLELDFQPMLLNTTKLKSRIEWPLSK